MNLKIRARSSQCCGLALSRVGASQRVCLITPFVQDELLCVLCRGSKYAPKYFNMWKKRNHTFETAQNNLLTHSLLSNSSREHSFIVLTRRKNTRLNAGKSLFPILNRFQSKILRTK